MTDKVRGKLRKDKVYLRRTRKVPTGVTYRYTKVHGSEGKTTELIVFDDKLLAASGLFEISEDSAQLVIDEPIETAIKLKNSNSLLVLTYDQRIKLYELESENWIEKSSSTLPTSSKTSIRMRRGISGWQGLRKSSWSQSRMTTSSYRTSIRSRTTGSTTS